MNPTLVIWRRTGPHLTRFCPRHLLPHPSFVNYSTSSSSPSSGPDHQSSDLLPFTQCGVRPALARALASSFNITTPTPLQANLLSLLARSPTRDLIVRNATGSGKSFALAVGLLNSPRAPPPLFSAPTATEAATGMLQPAHVLIVPHPDLAHQLTRWIHALVPADLHAHVVAHALPGTPDPSTANPHVLIGTPARVLELVNARALDPRSIGTLALDEVDQLSPPIPRWDVQRAGVRRRHPRPVEVLVAQLAALRSGSPVLADMQGDELVRMLTATSAGKDARLEAAEFKAWLRGKPRVVAVSATASSVVRAHLVGRLKWMHPRRWAFVDGQQHHVGQRVRHCALVVEAGKARVESLGVVEQQESELGEGTKVDEAAPASVTDLASSLVAYARATDVKHALVVVLGDAGVNRAVDELSKLYNVRASVWSASAARPATSATDPWIHFSVVSYGGIRGLDIPDLTHVFLLGAPADASEYQHIAGRVGRLGGNSSTTGKDAMVVTFCDVKGGERLRQIWRWMGDKKVRVELVDAEVVDKVKFGGTV